MTEPCTQETNIALVQQATTDIKTDIGKMLKILDGNGDEGLTTKVALNKQSIKRMWWWVGGISLAILGVAFFAIRSFVT